VDGCKSSVAYFVISCYERNLNITHRDSKPIPFGQTRVRGRGRV